MIRVQNDGNTVLFRHGSDVKGPRDSTSNGGTVIGVVQALATIKLRAARGELNDNGGIVAASGFEASVDAGATDAVDGRNGVACWL